MKKILFVCMGNICRSPMAEGIVKQEFMDRGIEAEFDSAGTIAFHVGEAPDYRAQQEARKHGVDISRLRARKFTVSDFDNFDLIYAMDHNNYSEIMMFADDEQAKKVDLFMNIASPGSNQPVPDPYYNDGFPLVYKMIKKSAEALADKFENGVIN